MINIKELKDTATERRRFLGSSPRFGVVDIDSMVGVGTQLRIKGRTKAHDEDDFDYRKVEDMNMAELASVIKWCEGQT